MNRAAQELSNDIIVVDDRAFVMKI
jgi:hypothetical protein